VRAFDLNVVVKEASRLLLLRPCLGVFTCGVARSESEGSLRYQMDSHEKREGRQEHFNAEGL